MQAKYVALARQKVVIGKLYINFHKLLTDIYVVNISIREILRWACSKVSDSRRQPANSTSVSDSPSNTPLPKSKIS